MAFPGIFKMLFENSGAGPKLRGDILPPAGFLPPGLICMWSGLVTAIPTGWAICNGSNGTPDLSGRFVMGANTSSILPGQTGGANTHTHTAVVGATTLTTSQIPAHDHVVSTNFSNSAAGSGGFVIGTKAGTTNAYSTTSSEGGGNSHTHTATISTGDNLPPYYVLAYIMKL